MYALRTQHSHPNKRCICFCWTCSNMFISPSKKQTTSPPNLPASAHRKPLGTCTESLCEVTSNPPLDRVAADGSGVSDWKPWLWWKLLIFKEENIETQRKSPIKKNIGHNPSPVVMIFPIYINGFGYTAQQIWVPNDPHVWPWTLSPLSVNISRPSFCSLAIGSRTQSRAQLGSFSQKGQSYINKV